ncbi:hypothetical protein NOMA109596_18175 [Nocardioides marinus]
MEDDLAGTARAGWSRRPLLAGARRCSTTCVSEIEGEVAAAEVAQRLRPTDVERVGRAGGKQLVGDGADRVLELFGVGAVQQAGQGDAAGGADGPGGGEVEGDVQRRGGVDLLHLTSLGVEPGCRLGSQPLHGGERGGAHDVGQVRIDERSGLGGELTGDLGDPPYPPHLHLTCFEASPDFRQPVLGLHRIGEQGPAGVGGTAEGGGELDDGELRHFRRTRTGELEHGVGTRHPEPGDPRVLGLGVGVVVGQPVGAVEVRHQLAGGVAVGPLSDRDEPVPVGLIGSLVEVADGGQQVTGRPGRRVLRSGVVVPECHDQILLEQVFEWNGREGTERICGGRSSRNRSEHLKVPQGRRATATRYRNRSRRQPCSSKMKGLLQRGRRGAHPRRPRSRSGPEGVA